MKATKLGWVLVVLVITSSAWAAEREIQRTFQLEPGAEVEVSGINGKLEIETGGGGQAVVSISRRADSERDFETRPVFLEQTGNRLVLRIEDRGRSRSVRDDVVLRLPESVAELSIRGVNGRVSSSYVEGRFWVEGINGPVRLSQGSGELEVSGINGRVEVEMGAPAGSGVHLSAINGSIRLMVPRHASFRVEASSQNGKVHIDLPGVDIEVDERNQFRASVGQGETPIYLKSINGRIEIGS